MNKQVLFKYCSVSAVLVFITMYSYFWYSAGLVGFSNSLNIIWGILISVIYAAIAVTASKSQYLEKKHSIIFAIITILPVLLGIGVMILGDGEIFDYAVVFVRLLSFFLIISTILYVTSIFVKD